MRIYLIILNLQSLYSHFFKKRWNLGRKKKRFPHAIYKKDLGCKNMNEENIYEEIDDKHIKRNFSYVDNKDLCPLCSNNTEYNRICFNCGNKYYDIRENKNNCITSNDKGLFKSYTYNDSNIDEDGYLKPIKKEIIRNRKNHSDSKISSVDDHKYQRVLKQRNKLFHLLRNIIRSNKLSNYYLEKSLCEANSYLKRFKIKREGDRFSKQDELYKSSYHKTYLDSSNVDSYKHSIEKNIFDIENKIDDLKTDILILRHKSSSLKGCSITKDDNNNESESNYINQQAQECKTFYEEVEECKDEIDQELKYDINKEDLIMFSEIDFNDQSYEDNFIEDDYSDTRYDEENENAPSDLLSNSRTIEEENIKEVESNTFKDDTDKDCLSDFPCGEENIKEVESNTYKDDKKKNCLSDCLCEEEKIVSSSVMNSIKEEERCDDNFKVRSNDDNLGMSVMEEKFKMCEDISSEALVKDTKLKDLKETVFREFSVGEDRFIDFYNFFNRNYKIKCNEEIELLYYSTFLVIKEIMRHLSQPNVPDYFIGELEGRKVVKSKNIYKYDISFIRILCKDILNSLEDVKFLSRITKSDNFQFKKTLEFFKYLLKINKTKKDPLIDKMKLTFKDFILKNEAVLNVQRAFEEYDLVERIVISLLRTIRSF